MMRDLLTEMYRRMVLIRQFEMKVNELFLQGIMPGTIHLSVGQEASVVGACLALEADDVITLTHRGHGQALAKGLGADALMAELCSARRRAAASGKGGSLHIGDMSVGALPAIAIVGASSPIAAGMAFAFKRQETETGCALNFFGEGTANKGDWHEALNLAVGLESAGNLPLRKQSVRGIDAYDGGDGNRLCCRTRLSIRHAWQHDLRKRPHRRLRNCENRG